MTKRLIREWWTARLEGSLLVPARGCTRVVVKIDSEIEESSTREPQRVLTANIGDRLMVFGAGLDEVLLLEVSSVHVEGWSSRLLVVPLAGAANDGAVSLLKVRRSA